MVRRAGRLAGRLLSLHYEQPQQFSRSQWQTSPTSRTYLVYRWVLLVALVLTAVASFANQEIYPPNPALQLNYFKWFIYLTNWGFMMCAAQATLALLIVHRARASTARSLVISGESGGSESLEVEEAASQLSWRGRTPLLCRVYWLTQTIATDLAFVVSLVYWAKVHDPKIHRLNLLNVLVHGGNSLVMLAEVLVTSHPVRPCHALYTVAFGALYGAFSALYFVSGGTGRCGEPAIYASLDWRRPGGALAFVALCVGVMCAAHGLAVLLACARTRLAARCRHCRAARAPPPPLDKLSAIVAAE